MDTICVQVCFGTTCYLLGGSELTRLGQNLPEAWKGRVRMEGTVCLDLCRASGALKPPFVRVNGTVVAQATTEKVVALLGDLL